MVQGARGPAPAALSARACGTLVARFQSGTWCLTCGQRNPKRLRPRARSHLQFMSPDNMHLCHADAVDFLTRLLKYDHQERMTCKEAMQHRYLAPIHAAAAAQTQTQATAAAPQGASAGSTA
jgi:hypothetical protein